MAKLSKPAEEAIRELVEDLVSGDYSRIQLDGRIGRLTVNELERVISSYGRTLTRLPEDALDIADIYPVEGSAGLAAIEVPLWTVEEGRSDLILSLTLNESMGEPTVSIDDLHVL